MQKGITYIAFRLLMFAASAYVAVSLLGSDNSPVNNLGSYYDSLSNSVYYISDTMLDTSMDTRQMLGKSGSSLMDKASDLLGVDLEFFVKLGLWF